MRVAAVALVLLVGAAVVLAFANTLSSWVLGGLLGGLAALLISIPVSLALFTLLARRHDARQRFQEESVAFGDVPEFADEYYEDRLVYEAEGYVFTDEDDFPVDPRTRVLLNEHRLPVSGYLALPTARDHYDNELEEERFAYGELQNYPRQPRHPARSVDPESGVVGPQTSQQSTQPGSWRSQSTSSLSQHQSAALRQACQEAQQDRTRLGSGSLSRRPQGKLSQRPNRSRRPSFPRTTGSQRQTSGQDISSWATRQEQIWRSYNEGDTADDERLTTEHVRERYQQQHYPRRSSYPRRPRPSRSTGPAMGGFDEAEDYEQDGTPRQRSRHVTHGPGGSLHNPLVRRAPYLYDDDPLRDEFAQQLGGDRPITRRSSRSDQYEDDEEY